MLIVKEENKISLAVKVNLEQFADNVIILM